MMADGSTPSEPAATPHRHWYRFALVVTVALILIVLATLPFALQSMQEVHGRGPDPLYDLASGKVVTPATAAAAAAEAAYVNLGLVALDEEIEQVTLAVSGNRNCGESCPSLALTFVALDDDANQRRGFPPLATLDLAPDDRVFSQAVQLPVRGQPSLYPFDQYQLWLGVGGFATQADGTTVEITPETLGDHAVVTVQDRIPDMIMAAPETIAPETVRAATDPYGFMVVQSLTFERPAYQKELAVVLVLLITISAALALFTRRIDELVLGIGGLILGVWGVRSVLTPSGLSTITAVDLALTWLILLLLLGLAVRAALHFHRHSDLPLGRPRQRV